MLEITEKRGENLLRGGTSGRRTDASTDVANGNERLTTVVANRNEMPTRVVKPTYAEIASRLVKSKDRLRNSK